MDERTIQTINLDGGCLCFDFINTVNSRRNFEYDYLNSYSDLLDWCKKVGALPDARLKKLRSMANENNRGAGHAFSKAKKIRESMYQLFSNIHQHKAIPVNDLDEVNRAIADTLSNLQIQVVDKALAVGWTNNLSLDEPLWRIMKSCFDVWTQESPDRMKECERCGWIFLDKSKNKKRRWCNMQVCGSHDKALRYYYKMKEK